MEEELIEIARKQKHMINLEVSELFLKLIDTLVSA